MSDNTDKDEQKTERFNMFMSPSEMKAIDDWAWENKIRSKSEAVRRLVQIGIRAHGELQDILDSIKKSYYTLIKTDEINKTTTQDEFFNNLTPKIAIELIIEMSLLLNEARTEVADSYIKALSLNEETTPFRSDRDMDELISLAEQSRERSNAFWEKMEQRRRRRQGDEE